MRKKLVHILHWGFVVTLSLVLAIPIFVLFVLPYFLYLWRVVFPG